MADAPFARIFTWREAALVALGLLGLAALASLAGPALIAHWPVRTSSGAAHTGHMSAEQSAARPRSVVRPVSTEAIPNLPGQQMSVVVVEFPPGGFSPRHVHGGSLYVYVLSGVIRSQLEGGVPGYYKQGDTFFEPQGIIHVFAENMSATEPATILAVFVHQAGATLTTYLD